MDEKRLVDGATALVEKQSRVIKIEPAERPQNVRLRVAAYTRVSSDSEDQLNDSVHFCLKNGLELRESIERTVR